MDGAPLPNAYILHMRASRDGRRSTPRKTETSWRHARRFDGRGRVGQACLRLGMAIRAVH